jgi:hypothetical protein
LIQDGLLSDLQNKLVAEFNRRSNPGSGESLASQAATFTTLNDVEGILISANDINKILMALEMVK